MGQAWYAHGTCGKQLTSPFFSPRGRLTNTSKGVTGAGKTALLDTLAGRITTGIVNGSIYVDGYHRDASFPHRIGYVQQEDIHLRTTTVREALEFSALLRQPNKTPKKDRLAYVDYVLDIMEMASYAEAIVGVPGEGLNVEQRKRLTIAVEMAAKPDLLLFVGMFPHSYNEHQQSIH